MIYKQNIWMHISVVFLCTAVRRCHWTVASRAQQMLWFESFCQFDCEQQLSFEPGKHWEIESQIPWQCLSAIWSSVWCPELTSYFHYRKGAWSSRTMLNVPHWLCQNGTSLWKWFALCTQLRNDSVIATSDNNKSPPTILFFMFTWHYFQLKKA